MSIRIEWNEEAIKELQSNIIQHPEDYAVEAECPLCGSVMTVTPGVNHCSECGNDFEIVYQIGQ